VNQNFFPRAFYLRPSSFSTTPRRFFPFPDFLSLPFRFHTDPYFLQLWSGNGFPFPLPVSLSRAFLFFLSLPSLPFSLESTQETPLLTFLNSLFPLGHSFPLFFLSSPDPSSIFLRLFFLLFLIGFVSLEVPTFKFFLWGLCGFLCYWFPSLFLLLLLFSLSLLKTFFLFFAPPTPPPLTRFQIAWVSWTLPSAHQNQ